LIIAAEVMRNNVALSLTGFILTPASALFSLALVNGIKAVRDVEIRTLIIAAEVMRNNVALSLTGFILTPASALF